MAKEKLPAERVFGWLRSNLGKYSLAPLTGTDARALHAAVQVADLWSFTDDRPAAAQAFRLVVEAMQRGTRELAYHAIAMVTDWSFRDELWAMAGLEPLGTRRLCAFERGGCGRDLTKEDVPPMSTVQPRIHVCGKDIEHDKPDGGGHGPEALYFITLSLDGEPVAQLFPQHFRQAGQMAAFARALRAITPRDIADTIPARR